MITRLEIKNFKSSKHTTIQPKALNLLTGLNSSGKSTLIQTFLLLRQSPEIDSGKLLLQEAPQELYDAGVAGDVYAQFGEGNIVFSFTFDETTYEWQFPYNSEENAIDDSLQASQTYPREQLRQLPLFSNAFQYLCAERIGPQDEYPLSTENVIKRETLGMRGEHTAYFLEEHGLKKAVAPSLQHPKAKSEQLIYQAAAWLGEISPGVKLLTKKISNESVEIAFEFGIRRNKPKHVGFGLSYVLPVLVSILSGQPGKLLLIENPESHIHPCGQVELGRLLARAAQAGMQLFVETHSDHILNGIRLACKQDKLNPELFTAFFFKRNEEESKSDITQIVFDQKGKLYQYQNGERKAQIPRGFFDEWKDSMFKLV